MLVPMCPAIPGFFYQPYRVWHNTLAPMTTGLLEEEPAVVISGGVTRFWSFNSQIGKTTAVKKKLIPRLRRQGKSTAYMNIHRLIAQPDLSCHRYHHHYDYERLLKQAGSLPKVDVLILDEIHHTFPCERGLTYYKSMRKPYSEPIIEFWKSVDAHVERGGKLVFVSAIHPCYVGEGNQDTHDLLITPPILMYFTAPIIELGTRIWARESAT